MVSYFQRYCDGEHEQVWRELVDLGQISRKTALYQEAEAVAHEAMRRVRYNIEQLLPHLQDVGYHLGYEWMAPEPFGDENWIASQPAPYTPPPHDVATQVVAFEAQVFPLPLSVRAFFLEVGTINLVGFHPKWGELTSHGEYDPLSVGSYGFDPLQLWSFTEEFRAFWEERHVLNEERAEEELELYDFPLAPNYALKYNIPQEYGEDYYMIALPDNHMDVPLLNEWHNTNFVNYLRICLAYGGLPGLAFIEDEVAEELAYLRKDLLPF